MKRLLFAVLLFLAVPRPASAQCYFGESARLDMLTTGDGHVVELFEGFLRVDGKLWSGCDGFPGTYPVAIAAQGDSFVLALRPEGLWRYEAGAFAPLDVQFPATITALAQVGDVLYVATTEGLHRVDDAGATRIAPRGLLKRRVAALAAEGTRLHVGLDPAGHVVLDEAGKPRVVDREALVGCFRRDARGVPVPRPPGASCREDTKMGELPSSHVTSLASFHDQLVVGFFDAGLAVLERGEVRARFAEPRFVNAVIASGDDLYVAAREGLYRADTQGGQLRALTPVPLPLAQRHVHDVVRAVDGTLWIATSHGLVSMRGGEVHVLDEGAGLPSHIVNTLALTPDGALWVGTLRGLARLRDGGIDTYSTATGNLPQDWVTALSVRGEQLLVGTYDAGVIELGGAPRAVAGTERAWVNPRGLGLHDGHLYVATMGDGLLRDGLPFVGSTPSRDVTAVVAHQGSLWVGTRNGLARLPGN